MINKNIITILLIIVLAIILYWLYRKNFKQLNTPSVCLITGGVKTGKSLLASTLSRKDYKRRHFKWLLATKIFRKHIEEPLYYTNCECSFGTIKGANAHKHKLDKNIRNITLDDLLRNKRLAYGSVVYINEASLMADNMDFNNKERNVDLSLFNKLFGHETRGGSMYYDTQSPLDSHYSIKRVMSTYFFIQKSINILIGRVLYVREMINQENGVNSFEDDIDTTTRKVFVGRWNYKKYDRYEFDYLTKDLEVSQTEYSFKKGLVSFNPLYISRASKKRKEEKK